MRAIRHFTLAVLLSFPCFTSAHAVEDKSPTRMITYNLEMEDWVSTQTARLVVNLQTSVNGADAAGIGAHLTENVNELGKGEWHLTSLNRNVDGTGLERWNLTFETRMPEANLSGIFDKAKKMSKPGLQINIVAVDFTPSVAEMGQAEHNLRKKMVKEIQDQLTQLNQLVEGPKYRILRVIFGGPQPSEVNVAADVSMSRAAPMMKNMMAMGSAGAPETEGAANTSVSGFSLSRKIMGSAQVVLSPDEGK